MDCVVMYGMGWMNEGRDIKKIPDIQTPISAEGYKHQFPKESQRQD